MNRITGILIRLSIILFFLGSIGNGICMAKEILPEFEDFLSLRIPNNPIISPDGRFILYSVRVTLWETNEYREQIWMADVTKGTSIQLTSTDQSCYDVKWSPDGRFITFLAPRNEGLQIRSMSFDGGESRAITHSPTGIDSFEWSPDGKYIAYLAPDITSREELELEKKYGRFEIVDEGFHVKHLWMQDMDTGKVINLVDRKDLNIDDISWSPDCKMIAFAATPDTRINSFSKSDIYVVNITNKEVRTLIDQIGPDRDPVWSPDSKTIAFRSSPGTEAYFAKVDIYTVPAKGGALTCLTKDFDEDVDIVTWNRSGIFFTASQEMAHHLFLLDPNKKKIDQITESMDFELDGVSLSSDGEKMAFMYRNSQKIKELYFSEVKAFEPMRLTDFSRQIKGWKLSKKEVIRWKSKDGIEITGVLTKPADFDPNNKYPLFVFIHGGPEDTSRPYKLDPWNRYYPLLQLAAKGAIILQPNYRGSAGFGENFRKLNYRNLGVGSYQDIISGVDFVISKGYVDINRIASMGWSHGGYLSAFIACYSDRFKAVSAGGVTADWEIYHATTDLPDSTYHYLGAWPWEDPEIYKKTSPISYVKNAKTPTLLQNGEFDGRVPIANALQLYRALKSKGVPTKLIIYKGCGHGISRPKENLAVLSHNWQWFKKYMWNED
jgi:dipeptidyl aminopeptidase/acylaminoacyl peptidase